MAKSKFEYVKQFEQPDSCLPNCWLVVRVDGKNFHKFSDTHNFLKPNDVRSLNLMSKAAEVVMNEFKDIILAYGQSDEYSFVFKRNTNTYNRRASKLSSTVCSLFTSAYVFHWRDYFIAKQLQYPPAFDSRTIAYPTIRNIKDYLCWRQADCHINNLYNTCFWKLVQEANNTPKQAQERLKGTLSSDKNEILYTQFGMNYNNESEIFRKGSVLLRKKIEETVIQPVPTANGLETVERQYTKSKVCIVPFHCDIIGEKFWRENPDLLGTES
ncbi:probable tRNA(His) guanylyltransferase isoform X2 [Lineus longissimus]|uniref:probable tRNA(His) guanylyltransferase isoform X2 n=1 Tax=Lineus longissimus TaxID=88925 RepID=UPI002B4D0C30